MSDEPTIFASVWDALEDSPEAAAHMRLRSELMMAIRDAVARWHIAPNEASRRLGVSLKQLDDLQRGRISRFALDDLVGLAEKAKVVIEVRQAAE